MKLYKITTTWMVACETNEYLILDFQRTFADTQVAVLAKSLQTGHVTRIVCPVGIFFENISLY